MNKELALSKLQQIMLVMELGLRFQEMKYEMMEIYQMEMDESRSILVWDRDLPVPFGSVQFSVSPCFGEQSQLELEKSRSGPDRSRSGQVVWGDGLRAGTEEGDGGSHPR